MQIAAKAAGRGDAAYVAGCLFRAVGICAHALHRHAGCWLINEKGTVSAAGALPSAPADFAMRAARRHGDLRRRADSHRRREPAPWSPEVGDGVGGQD